jgi:hypothetical protein
LAESLLLSGDVVLVINTLQRFIKVSQGRFDSSDLHLEGGGLVARFPAIPIALSLVVESEVKPCHSVLVQVYAINPPHEHEADAACAAKSLFQRSPVSFHFTWALLHFSGACAEAACALPCWYIELNSSFNSTSCRSSSSVGRLFRCVVMAGDRPPVVLFTEPVFSSTM